MTMCTIDYSRRYLSAGSDMQGIGAGRNTLPLCLEVSVQDAGNTPEY
jgi:hypothetical protein